MMEEPPSRLPAWLTDEDIRIYGDAYATSGFFGPVSWYRNSDRNYETAEDLSPNSVTMPRTSSAASATASSPTGRWSMP
jgi:hypothetical protein